MDRVRISLTAQALGNLIIWTFVKRVIAGVPSPQAADWYWYVAC